MPNPTFALRAVPLLLALLLPASPAWSRADAPASPDTGVMGIRLDQLQADYWIKRLPGNTGKKLTLKKAAPDKPILDPATIAAQNARLFAEDASMFDLAALADSLPGAQVRQWIERLQPSFERALYDEGGQLLDIARLQAGVATALDLDRIGPAVAPRWGLVVRRADLRAVPDRLRVFRSADDHDIDRWQESALFPGTPVALVHESEDGHWWFAVSPNYAAWIEKQYVAEGSREQVLGYAKAGAHLVVTGAQVRSTFTPEEPRVSSLQLDMGLKLPVLDWPARQPVNGQDPYASHVVQLPVREADGSLAFAPALLPRGADVAAGYLPLTQSNLIRQGFKFLGERYGWGHGYDTRDCSGFVSEVYRSFGVELPRNTSAQAVSPALNRIALGAEDSREKRLQLLGQTQPGDLIYIPGHVMMVIGREAGVTWVIHDTAGVSWLDTNGQRIHSKLNGVAVTPLETLLSSGDKTFADIVTNIQRIRP